MEGKWSSVSWICWLSAVATLGFSTMGTYLFGWNALFMFLASFPLALTLAIRRYGWRSALIFWVISITISNVIENLSIHTGVPFGHYHYTGPGKVFEVPFMIGPIYASLGYISWTVANHLLGEVDRRLRRSTNLFILPLIAGAIMTMWDLVTDPQASTIGKFWIWEEGGNLFGVPESNFLGWWFTTYLFFQIFALYLARSDKPVASDVSYTGAVAPILAYFSMGLSVIIDWLAFSDRLATDATGIVWHEKNIVGSMATVTVFTMFFVAILTLHRVLEERRRRFSAGQ
ncbi:carotenoid biosynthesis protein [Sphingobium sp.]|uniref:carotenoid biosynthesis protein n=1 Tax=Sphingobium sp. TaxID=1912891 RepID=UPI0028BDFD7B|nr:carotenoid biosynthesis protein [Sphingobium sp.]